ncbi:MAG: hypothetical protein FWE52_01345 [Alphaproteobacteria bacterium]|nr:hypothetical protein [Alphaproteobacteria bacterium]
MKRFISIFSVSMIIGFSADVRAELPVIVSTEYLQNGLATRATTAIVSALRDDFDFIDYSLTVNNTIAKANSALQAGANISALANDAGYITGGDFVPMAQRAVANGVATLDAGTRIPYAQIPVGTTANTIAAGNDTRFNTIPHGAPAGNPPAGRVFIWMEH